MTRNMMIGLGAAAILVVGGGAAYYFTQQDENNTSTETSQSSSGDAGQASNTFNPAWSDSQPFVATISNNGEASGTISSNGQGAIQFSVTKDGKTSRFIYTNDAYYACTGEQCIKYPLSQASASSFDPSEYQYGEDRINELRGLSSYKGQQACGSSTCDVWEYSTEGTTTTLYLDPATRRIVQVKHVTANGETSDITYEYKDVTIVVPENAQEINLPNVSQ